MGDVARGRRIVGRAMRADSIARATHPTPLTEEEEKELDRYEEIDDYPHFLNRVVRNLVQTPTT